VDYITVSDYVDGNVHTIVLRTALSRSENQDVAVFIVEKLNNGKVRIQLIGDEALYGRNYIIEPNYAETANPGYMESRYWLLSRFIMTCPWPMMQFIFNPAHVFWRSACTGVTALLLEFLTLLLALLLDIIATGTLVTQHYATGMITTIHITITIIITIRTHSTAVSGGIREGRYDRPILARQRKTASTMHTKCRQK
jgi:hypothetical protein